MTYAVLELHLPNGQRRRNNTFDFEIHRHGHEYFFARKCEGVRHCMQDFMFATLTNSASSQRRSRARICLWAGFSRWSGSRSKTRRFCAPTTRKTDLNAVVQALEKCTTPQSITIVLFKKNASARHWPRLSKTMLTYVETDFYRWTWEGDESDDVEEDNMDIDGSSARINNGGLSTQVLTLRIGPQVHNLANENSSQTKQPRPASQPP